MQSLRRLAEREKDASCYEVTHETLAKAGRKDQRAEGENPSSL